MRYGSVCSGIEAATMAWHPLGWEPAFFSEIEAAPRAVLSHHYPNVPLHGDFTTIGAGEYGAIDLLVGGTPCQSFSVAGLRGGLGDDRGNLALEYLRLADRARPRWLAWENVPGVLSSNGGRDFGAILGGMVELGYGFAYGVLDAQHFGVPQRRRRVFVIGYLGDWRRAAAVLFERHSLQGHPPPRREKGERVADSLTVGANQCGGFPGDFVEASTGETSHCLNAGGMGRQDYETETLVAHSLRAQSQLAHRPDVDTLVAHSLRAEGFDASEDGTGRGTPLVPVCRDVAAALTSNYGKQPDSSDTALGPNLIAFYPTNRQPEFGNYEDVCPAVKVGSGGGGGNPPAVAIPLLEIGKGTTSRGVGPNGSGLGSDGDPMFTLQAGAQHGVGTTSAVRRLTPRECERLQGFPDDFTLVPYRGGMMKDGPRYKMLGNSMAVPVMRWIGERIAAVEALADKRVAA